MSVIQSAINTRSESFKANKAAMEELTAELKDKLAAAALGGNERSRERHEVLGTDFSSFQDGSFYRPETAGGPGEGPPARSSSVISRWALRVRSNPEADP